MRLWPWFGKRGKRRGMLEYDPARFMPRRGLLAHGRLHSARWRNIRRNLIARIGWCEDCGSRLVKQNRSPLLAGRGCPNGHVFVGNRNQGPGLPEDREGNP